MPHEAGHKVVEWVKVGSRGQGSLLRREGITVWLFRYSHRGQEHEESTKTTDLKAAKRFAKHKLDGMAVDRQGKGPYQSALVARVQVNELLDDLEPDYRLRGVKSFGQIQSHLKAIREAFGEWRAADVTGTKIDRYIEACLAVGTAPATINRRLQILGQAFRRAWQADEPKVTRLPRIRHLAESNVRQGFFEAEEFARLAAALPDDLRDLAAFGYLTGWRLGEITSLRWAWVDRAAAEIRLPDSKNGHGRVLVLEGELATLMARREQARLIETTEGEVWVADLVFHRQGQPIVDLRKAWAKACLAAGLFHVESEGGKARQVPDKLFHDLRRTAVRNLIRRGVPETVAMAISGHRTRSMFDRYNIRSREDLRRAMETATLPAPVSVKARG